jgi:hypothetical protein
MPIVQLIAEQVRLKRLQRPAARGSLQKNPKNLLADTTKRPETTQNIGIPEQTAVARAGEVDQGRSAGSLSKPVVSVVSGRDMREPLGVLDVVTALGQVVSVVSPDPWLPPCRYCGQAVPSDAWQIYGKWTAHDACLRRAEAIAGSPVAEHERWLNGDAERILAAAHCAVSPELATDSGELCLRGELS